MNQKQFHFDTKQISYCGFYCRICPKYVKKQCNGCKGEHAKCAVGYKACKVRPCCIENELSSCADCTQYASVKDCKIYNPLMIRVGEFIARTNRGKGIEMIKEKGEVEFIKFMIDKKWVTMKVSK